MRRAAQINCAKPLARVFLCLLALSALACADQPPAAPTGLTATTGDTRRGESWNAIHLNWNPVPGATGYTVYRGSTPGDENTVKPLAADIADTTYTDRRGFSGVTYYYKVTATNAAGASPYSDEASATPSNPLFRDRRAYPPFNLSWNSSTDISDVTGVFPHPLLPQRAVLATSSGLLLTDDSGRTWSNLPEASVDKIGAVRDVAFHPTAPGTFYAASQTRGIWVTTDNGKTFAQAGAKAKGLASDTVVSVMIYPGDPSYQTLLAAHGEGVHGLSRSSDGGQTWDVVNTDYCFSKVFGGDRLPSVYFLLIGWNEREPDVQNLYACNTPGEFISELLRDVAPTGLACAPIPHMQGTYGPFYMTTSDAGVYRIDNTQFVPEVKQLTLAGVDGWSSIGATWGPCADITNLYLYDPTKLGLVMTSDDLASTQTSGADSLVGGLVREGAAVRPNANGTVFYAVLNGSLSIGRMPPDVPVVDMNPPVRELSADSEIEAGWASLGGAFGNFAGAHGSTVAAAKALQQSVGDLEGAYHQCALTVTARLAAKSTPPKSVTVDLSRFGGAWDTPLAPAGNGVYSLTFAFMPEPQTVRPATYDWRSSWPGPVPLGVTATYPDGHCTGAVGIVDVHTQINDIALWARRGDIIKVTADGAVTAQSANNPPDIHHGSAALRLDLQKGAWTVQIKMPPRQDITSHEAISFWVRATAGQPPKEINLQLRDNPEYSTPNTTGTTPALRGIVPGNDYQRIVVPITGIMAGTAQFQSARLGEIILSGESDGPSTLFIDDLRILARYEETDSSFPPVK